MEQQVNIVIDVSKNFKILDFNIIDHEQKLSEILFAKFPIEDEKSNEVSSVEDSSEIILKVEPLSYDTQEEFFDHCSYNDDKLELDESETEKNPPKSRRSMRPSASKRSNKQQREVVLDEHKDIYLKLKREALERNCWPFYEHIKQEDGTDLHFFKQVQTSALYMASFDLRNKTCDICPEKTTTLASLIRHRNLHFFAPESLTCLACKMQFTSRLLLSRHTLVCQSKSKLDPLKCNICSKRFTKFKNLRIHESEHKTKYKRRQMCHLCSKSLYDGTSLQLHLRKMHGINPYQCAHCPKTFADLHQMRLHLMEKHFPDKCEYQCQFCKRLFATASRMQSHVELTHSETKVECKECHRWFSNPLTLKTHQANVHGELDERKKWYCDTCGKMFLRKHGLISHQDKHLSPEEYKFKCTVCDKALPNKYKLTAHMRQHEAPPTCQYCLKTFTTKQYLNDHLNLHTGEKPYECKLCNKKFGDRSNLRNHVKGHEANMGLKLTLNPEERRLVRQRVINIELPNGFK